MDRRERRWRRGENGRREGEGRTSSKASSGAQEVPHEEQKWWFEKAWQASIGVKDMLTPGAGTDWGGRGSDTEPVWQGQRWPWLGAQRRCHRSHWGQGGIVCWPSWVQSGCWFSRTPEGKWGRTKVLQSPTQHDSFLSWGHGAGDEVNQVRLERWSWIVLGNWRKKHSHQQQHRRRESRCAESRERLLESWRGKGKKQRAVCGWGKVLGMVYSGGREPSHFSTVHLGKSVCALNWKAHSAIFVGMCWVLWAECPHPFKLRYWNANPWCDGVVEWWGHEGEGPDWHWCPYKRDLPRILVLCIMWPAVRRWYRDRESWYTRGIWEASSPDHHAGLWT